jgi:hypothetical protein
VRDRDRSQVLPGYRIDLVVDPGVIVFRWDDRTVVARFNRKLQSQR